MPGNIQCDIHFKLLGSQGNILLPAHTDEHKWYTSFFQNIFSVLHCWAKFAILNEIANMNMNRLMK